MDPGPTAVGPWRQSGPKSDNTMSMPSPPFVHLHCHSHYSLLDGASKIPDLIERTKALGMPALALTDHGNLYGAVELLREAKAGGNPAHRRARGLRRTGQANRTQRRRRVRAGAFLSPDAAGPRRERIPELDAALVAVFPGGLLLQAQDR